MTRIQRFVYEVENTMPNVSGAIFKCDDQAGIRVTLRRQNKILESVTVSFSSIVNAESVSALAMSVSRILCNRYKARTHAAGLTTADLPGIH